MPSLTALDAVLAAMCGLRPPAAFQAVPVRAAAGLVLAEDLLVPQAVPAVPMALRPGYAVVSRELVGVSAYSPLGVPSPPPWVNEGEPLPPGCDAVIPADSVSSIGSLVEITASASPGENVRRPGEDATAGQRLRSRGQPLRLLDLAAAEAAGVATVAVRPVSLLVLAGDEDRMLASLIAGRGGLRARIERPADLAALDGAVPDDCDLVVAIGSQEGFPDHPQHRVLASGLAFGSAGTVRVGSIAQTPVLVLPPRLDAVVAVTLCLVEPFADRLSGRETRAVWRRGPLTRKLSSSIGITELALVRETMGGLEPLGAGSLTLGALANADGFLVIAPESEGFQAGDIVEARGL